MSPARYWGHGVLQRNCAHIRRTRDDRFALCHCLLIAVIDPDAEGVFRCSVCLDLEAEQGLSESGRDEPPAAGQPDRAG